jgi:hypothetical protein
MVGDFARLTEAGVARQQSLDQRPPQNGTVAVASQP